MDVLGVNFRVITPVFQGLLDAQDIVADSVPITEIREHLVNSDVGLLWPGIHGILLWSGVPGAFFQNRPGLMDQLNIPPADQIPMKMGPNIFTAVSGHFLGQVGLSPHFKEAFFKLQVIFKKQSPLTVLAVFYGYRTLGMDQDRGPAQPGFHNDNGKTFHYRRLAKKFSPAIAIIFILSGDKAQVQNVFLTVERDLYRQGTD